MQGQVFSMQMEWKENLRRIISLQDLKANQNFLELQSELSDIENKLAAARRFFNSATREYNTSIQSFPSNLIANHFGFTQVEFFELDDEAAKKAPKVQF